MIPLNHPTFHCYLHFDFNILMIDTLFIILCTINFFLNIINVLYDNYLILDIGTTFILFVSTGVTISKITK